MEILLQPTDRLNPGGSIRIQCGKCGGHFTVLPGSRALEKRLCSGCYYMDRPNAKEIEEVQ